MKHKRLIFKLECLLVEYHPFFKGQRNTIRIAIRLIKKIGKNK